MKRTVTRELKRLNKNWGIDFVRSDMGTCCNTCSLWRDDKVTQAWDDAETILVVKYFTQGMNYRGSFERQETLSIRYDLPERLTADKVCEDMRNSQIGELYEIIAPADVSKCIILNRKV